MLIDALARLQLVTTAFVAQGDRDPALPFAHSALPVGEEDQEAAIRLLARVHEVVRFVARPSSLTVVLPVSCVSSPPDAGV